MMLFPRVSLLASHRRRGPRPGSALGCVICALSLAGHGCHEPQAEFQEGLTQSIRVSNAWLKNNVDVGIDRAELNRDSGLFEVDASIVAEALEKGRRQSYRVVARACYYEGAKEDPVDVSEWSEFALEPGVRLVFQSTSLRPADRFVIELAYPEEVGLK